MQTLKWGDELYLPHDLSVMNTYTKVMAIPITVTRGIIVSQVVAVSAVPQVEVVPRTLEKLDEMQGIWQTRILVEWKREVLFQWLDLSGLKGWSDKIKQSTMPC